MSDLTGTANILHQFTLYNDLIAEYSPEVASKLTQRNLARNNIEVTQNEVEAWHRINTAAVNSQLDLSAEQQIANKLASEVVSAIFDNTSQNSSKISDTTSIDEDEILDELSCDEDEQYTLADMYGYEDDEDNEEAAFDDVLKMQERVD